MEIPEAGTPECHCPDHQIALRNTWYTDDQFKSQLSLPGTRAVVENRWHFFGEALDTFLQGKKTAEERQFRLLDAGCGDGINLFGLAEFGRRKGWEIALHGVDYNPLRVVRANAVGGTRGIARADLRCLPFSDGTFDIVLCNHVLEHIDEDVRVLAELRRVMQPDGLMLLGVPNEGCGMARFRNRVVQRSILRKTDHINFYRKETFLAKLRQADIEPVEVGRGSIFFPHSLLNTLLGYFGWGARLMMALGRMFPSQSADLLVAAQPEKRELMRR